MVTYLLLRDNKQLGPLTLDQLTEKGLKAYDLVWVEGKSAAWRYPSEIEELKPFAPVVEEQPFDRFYKKPVAENKPVNIPKKEVLVMQEEIPAPIEKQYASVSRSDKKVYVTLPGARPAAASVPLIKADTQQSKIIIKDQEILSEEKFVNQNNFGKEFLQSAEAEKNQYVEKNHQRQISPVRKNILKPFMVGAGVVALLATGIAIGFYINKPAAIPGSQKIIETNKQAESIGNTQENKPTQSSVAAVPVSDNKLIDDNANNNQLNNNKTDNNIAGNNTKTPLIDPITGKNNDSPAENKKTTEKKSKNVLPQKIPVNTPPAADSDLSQKAGIAHRQSSHRGDEISEKAVLKTNIADMVGVTAGKYSIGTFGGISNLQLTVSNHSVYPLDLVVVEVQYVQANKKIFKTENVYFRNINGGAALMQEAPKSPRGIKVEYKIVLINSKESGLSYSGS